MKIIKAILDHDGFFCLSVAVLGAALHMFIVWLLS